MKIGKNEAENIAKAVLAARLKEVENLVADVKSKAMVIVDYHIPVLLRKTYESYPAYVRDTKYVRLKQIGANRETDLIDLPRRIPGMSEYGNAATLEVSESECKMIKDLQNKVQCLRDQYDKDLFDLKASILAFGTHAKLLKELPELAQYVSNTSSTALALIPDVDKVRKILSNS